MTPPSWLIARVCALTDTYPLALSLAKPAKGRAPKCLRRCRESLEQRAAMVRELLEVWPHPWPLQRVLGITKGAMLRAMERAGVTTADCKAARTGRRERIETKGA